MRPKHNPQILSIKGVFSPENPKPININIDPRLAKNNEFDNKNGVHFSLIKLPFISNLAKNNTSKFFESDVKQNLISAFILMPPYKYLDPARSNSFDVTEIVAIGRCKPEIHSAKDETGLEG